jgi:hypothetical protein
MLSESQKSADGPLYEASLQNASSTDPSFLAMSAPANATLNLGFYDPCHVRYTRQTMPGRSVYVALFLCPTSAGKSRVFLFNVFEGSLIHAKTEKPRMSIRQIVKKWTSIAMWKLKFRTALMKRIFTPVFTHQIGHRIFDGDGIFLHKQGNRMQNRGLTYRDYSTPGPADLMVNVFRRRLDAAIKVTRKAGEDAVANTFLPIFEYTDDIPRSAMLDRYESHTKHCKVCSSALRKKEKERALLGAVQTGLFGSVGACATTALVALLVMTLSATTNQVKGVLSASILKVGASALLAAIASLFFTKRAMTAVDAQIRQFKFVDYVHAEKH